MIQLSEEEYRDLVNAKQAFVDMCQIKKKAGEAYDKYMRLIDMNHFLEKRYGEVYKKMVAVYNECRDL